MRANRKGQAAVELAITMVLLIPLIFFALFLQDFAYYKMEGQEPTVTATSDFIVPDYMRPAGKTAGSDPVNGQGNGDTIGHFNRLKYCDHTAGYDSYNRDFECDSKGGGGAGGTGGAGSVTGQAGGDLGHHHATGAHQCWIGGGQQIFCPVQKNLIGELAQFPGATPFVMSATTDWNKGGVVTCSAQLRVFNWIIPSSIQQGGGWLWSKKGNTDRKLLGGGNGEDQVGKQDKWNEKYGFNEVHSDGTSDGSKAENMGSWALAKQFESSVVDPWALNDIDPVDPHTGGFMTSFLTPGMIPGRDQYSPLLDRTGNYYNHYAKDGIKKGNDWIEQMQKKKFLDDYTADLDVAGDKLDSVPVYWNKDAKRERGGDYASGYYDQRQKQFGRDAKTYPWTLK